MEKLTKKIVKKIKMGSTEVDYYDHIDEAIYIGPEQRNTMTHPPYDDSGELTFGNRVFDLYICDNVVAYRNDINGPQYMSVFFDFADVSNGAEVNKISLNQIRIDLLNKINDEICEKINITHRP